MTDAERTPEAASATDPGSLPDGGAIPDPPTADPLTAPATDLSAAGPVPPVRSQPDVTGDDEVAADTFSPHVFDGLTGADGTPAAAATGSLSLLHDVEMTVTVELGRTTMALRDVLELTPGSVVELDRSAGSPVDLLVNGTLIARGEVVVIDEEFALRVTEIVEAAPRRRAG